MLILIPLLFVSLIIDFTCLIFGKRKLSLFIFVVIVIVNYYTETVPLNLFKKQIDAPSDFKVLCYNVKSSSNDYMKFQLRIAEEIINEHPDLVYLCEFEYSRSKVLDSVMTNQMYNRILHKGTHCVFYSRFETDSIVCIPTDEKHRNQSLINKIRIKPSSNTITVVGCHLSSSRKDLLGGYRKRKSEADSIVKYISTANDPIIVIGDMNDFSGSYPINRIKDVGLKDAWWEGGTGYGSTFHSGIIQLRLDHILYQYSKLELLKTKVIKSEFSDHDALVAEFNFIKKGN